MTSIYLHLAHISTQQVTNPSRETHCLYWSFVTRWGSPPLTLGLYISDDNPHIEALFRTTKYWPGYPYGGFESLTESRIWVDKFVTYYNYYHRHSSLKFVTPHDVHEGNHMEVLSKRAELYEKARELSPRRWVNSKVRDWTPPGGTWTTPPRDRSVVSQSLIT